MWFGAHVRYAEMFHTIENYEAEAKSENVFNERVHNALFTPNLLSCVI